MTKYFDKDFMESMEKILNDEKSVTENGAIGYKTSGEAMLDFEFMVSSYRNMNSKQIINDFMKFYTDDRVLALKFLFFIRDREEGMGERRLFRIVLRHLANVDPTNVKKLIPIVAEYGREDDIFYLFGTALEGDALDYICMKLDNDLEMYDHNCSVSLLAKWLPSENGTCENTRKMARKIIKALKADCTLGTGLTTAEVTKEYRKTLSKLREYIDVTERKMCANEWDKIDYQRVPSRANLLYSRAFFKHDEERRTEYLDNVKRGTDKINSSKLYPHDILSRLNHGAVLDDMKADQERIETLEALWNALPKYDVGNTLVVVDGSGSMSQNVGNTNITAEDVARALGIYFAENCKGQFHNTCISFSKTPKLVKFTNEELYWKNKQLEAYNDWDTTNIEAVFSLILKTAIKSRLTQEQLPDRILMISDMEFNNLDGCYDISEAETLFGEINARFRNAGYKMPKLVFWNVCSRTATIPMKENELGLALISGFSTNLVDMVMSNELDPYKILLQKLATKRYDMVENALTKKS